MLGYGSPLGIITGFPRIFSVRDRPSPKEKTQMNMNRITKQLIVIVALLSIAYGAGAQTLDENATLTKATIQFETPSDVENSEVSGTVNFTAGQPSSVVVASTPVEVNKGKSDKLNLRLVSDKITRKESSDGVLFIQFQPKDNSGRDRWIFTYTLELTFSDGKNCYMTVVKKILLDRENSTEAEKLHFEDLLRWGESLPQSDEL
jgi:hypothetical protein